MAPPALGQHTQEILSKILGYSNETIQTLANDKVVQLIWFVMDDLITYRDLFTFPITCTQNVKQ